MLGCHSLSPLPVLCLNSRYYCFLDFAGRQFGVVVKGMVWGHKNFLNWNPNLHLMSCKILVSFNFFEPHVLICITVIIVPTSRSLWGFNKLIHVKCLEQGLAHSKAYVDVSYHYYHNRALPGSSVTLRP